ncbi:hypothetical protein N7492_008629 [Penicillium capsulatum]|uniref:Uncharacterized protein n=1 Tax=Penicillium capsulatum TaxID=69766 RepID=A0A9W9HTU8_9EURO|nr:hypothetical protein N7492_008629 [Penicillium capsulatum]
MFAAQLPRPNTSSRPAIDSVNTVGLGLLFFESAQRRQTATTVSLVSCRARIASPDGPSALASSDSSSGYTDWSPRLTGTSS